MNALTRIFSAAKPLVLLGGSFNPIHIGHIRLAIEILESIPVQRVDFIPSAEPPHKLAQDILPFDVRLSMLEASLHGMEHLHINPLESARQGPSYTWDTLKAYNDAAPHTPLLFVVGGEDFCALPHWHRGTELPSLAHIAMVPRAGNEEFFFKETVQKYWPEAHISADGHTATWVNAHALLYLPLPRLDISASFIRKRWLQGKCVRYLMPDAALDVLNEARQSALECWQHTTTA